jgi:hypothetical protein
LWRQQNSEDKERHALPYFVKYGRKG